MKFLAFLFLSLFSYSAFAHEAEFLTNGFVHELAHFALFLFPILLTLGTVFYLGNRRRSVRKNLVKKREY